MPKHLDLTKGNIFKELLKLALPIMGTSFIQMAYNLTDMLWLGRVGSTAVAAVGTVGFFLWLGMALSFTTKIGAEISVSQSIGAQKHHKANVFAKHGITMALVFAVFFMALLLIFGKHLLAFFRLENPVIFSSAYSYLKVVSFGVVFTFVVPTITGVYNGSGDSKTPFIYSTIGLLINILLDPIFIFGAGKLPALGATGAAIATVFSQMIVFLLFIINPKYGKILDLRKPLCRLKAKYVKQILRLGFPVSAQSALFSVFSMILARILTRWGELPIAVQKIGTQVEALSWMTASGFSSALSAFTGQNFGAHKYNRIRKGYYTALAIMAGIGIINTSLLVFLPETIFSFFINEPNAIAMGKVYLRILGYSQFFMVVEITTSGGFNGLGKTLQPTLVSVLFTGMRVPAALFLASEAILGLTGVWWSVSISSIIKGIILVAWYFSMLNCLKNTKPGTKLVCPVFSRFKSSS